jgi:chromosome segregation protein
MRIKRLDITGFKSFMERTVFTFGDGITAVVGPNGCGKSNVVDAIRWVMGEQSAKNLRGRGMEDVIFNGSESKPPLSMAEVSLTFHVDDSDQLAPQYQGLPEITVTRRLFRSGESEYLINRTTCRLLDVTELFLGTGVGTRAYSIIEQGRVGLIVSSKPEDRRSLIEEAAGITKYKARRKAAERKMEATQANLLRVNDIVGELDKRLDSLQRQVKRAEKYKKLKAEMRDIELHAASHRFLELHAQAGMLAGQLGNLGEEEKAALERVRALESGIEERRRALEAEAEALNQLQARVHALESQTSLDDQNLGHWQADAAETRARAEEAQRELAALEARLSEVEVQVAAREAELSGLDDGWRDDELKLKAMQEELASLTARQAELARRVEQEQAELVQVASRLANHESTLNALARQRADLEARTARLAGEVEALRKDEATLEQARTEAAARVDATRHLSAELAERKGQEEEALARTRQAFAENELQVISLREELADKRSRLASLQELQQHYEGFDRGVRAVMLRGGGAPRERGVFGLVADVLTVTPRYERAVEAALGERLQNVLVESRETGLELLDFLRSNGEGRSTFLPVDALPDPSQLPAAPDLSAHPGLLAHALQEVAVEPALEPVVRRLLGDVVVVTDVPAAESFSRTEAGRPYTLVTVEGEVLRPDGSMTGGALEGAAVGALHKKRELAELATEVARVEERYNEILTRHYALQKQMGQTEGVLRGLEKNRHAEEVKLAEEVKDLHRAGEDLARVRERVGGLSRDEAQLRGALASLDAEEGDSRGEVAQGQADRTAREERVRELSAELEAARARAATLSQEVLTLRVKVASNSERGDSARKELDSLLLQRDELVARQARVDATASGGQSRVEELQRRIEQTRADREARAAELAQGSAELEGRRTAHHATTTEVRDQEASLRELRGRLDELTQGVSQASLKERELALELSHLTEGIRSRHGVELAHAVQDYHLAPRLDAEAEHTLAELRASLEKLGEVNVTAIEEHAELAGRHAFLARQKEDLEASLSQLREAIEKIDASSRERFKQTFDVVNEKFQAVYPRLFGGGRAGLVLTQDPAGGEPGVEILAQPPGKKLQSVNLMSGGEKALTAVALIFGIFLIKPTPFCLLDEVDAPLDEGNVGRYNDMVREMSQTSQFILITHNKRTMEIADTMYGVTMEEPGISKQVSVNLREAAAANDNTSAA